MDTLDPPSPRGLQERSRRTAERIVAAAIDLLSSRRFESIAVAEIAGRAGVSVGGFYARFPSKAALLEYLNEAIFGRILEDARNALSPEATAGLGAREVIERYISMAVRAFRRHRLVLQQVALHSRTSTDESFRRRILEANRTLHGLFRARLAERTGEMRHADPGTAVDVALTAASGAMREYVLFQEYRPQFEPLEDGRLIAELTEMFCLYLGIQR